MKEASNSASHKTHPWDEGKALSLHVNTRTSWANHPGTNANKLGYSNALQTPVCSVKEREEKEGGYEGRRKLRKMKRREEGGWVEAGKDRKKGGRKK